MSTSFTTAGTKAATWDRECPGTRELVLALGAVHTLPGHKSRPHFSGLCALSALSTLPSPALRHQKPQGPELQQSRLILS